MKVSIKDINKLAYNAQVKSKINNAVLFTLLMWGRCLNLLKLVSQWSMSNDNPLKKLMSWHFCYHQARKVEVKEWMVFRWSFGSNATVTHLPNRLQWQNASSMQPKRQSEWLDLNDLKVEQLTTTERISSRKGISADFERKKKHRLLHFGS